MSEKKWNPDLWEPIGFKPVEIKDDVETMFESSQKVNSFLDYQAPEDRYEVRGIMPKAPEYPKREEPKIGRRHSFLGYLD